MSVGSSSSRARLAAKCARLVIVFGVARVGAEPSPTGVILLFRLEALRAEPEAHHRLPIQRVGLRAGAACICGHRDSRGRVSLLPPPIKALVSVLLLRSAVQVDMEQLAQGQLGQPLPHLEQLLLRAPAPVCGAKRSRF